ncbi:hypothetical protein PDE_00305 [Penicillium oxalicum 114-2]|uniref:Uncharacterized protein n=1 Tax=Penicillium oxalicum (strain 114-2 / CGMCC 5302) TaxID=933388 RepID=S8AU69_PENO1|nr:hypothetical protein PDE_00305 [Penicillium oxalicum 114-2]
MKHDNAIDIWVYQRFRNRHRRYHVAHLNTVDERTDPSGHDTSKLLLRAWKTPLQGDNPRGASKKRCTAHQVNEEEPTLIS